MLRAKDLPQSVIIPHRKCIVRRMLAVDQALDGVAIVVQDESGLGISADSLERRAATYTMGL